MRDSLDTIRQECAQALRAVWRSPKFSALGLLLLTATIGAALCLGTAAHELLAGSLPFGNAERLAMIWSDLPKSGYARAPLSGPEVMDLRARSKSFLGFGAISATTATLGTLQDPQQIPIGTVTHDFFHILQAQPLMGRLFTQFDEGTGKAGTAILSWSAWQSRFGGDPAILGRKILVDGQSTEVIAVMPASFRMAFAPDANIPEKTELWIPFRMDLSQIQRHRYFLRVIARLRDGETAANGSADVAATGKALAAEYTGYGSSGRQLFAVGLLKDLATPVQSVSYSLVFAGGFLLLVGFFNFSGLWIARLIERRSQFAVSQALGATVQQVRNQNVMQAVILLAAGSVLGIAAAHAGLIALKLLRPASLARIDHGSLSWPVLLGVLIAVAAFGLLLAVLSLPAISPLQSTDVLRTRVSAAPRQHLRAALIAGQFSLALVFLLCSALFARTLWNVLNTESGFRPESALTFRYSLNGLGPLEQPAMSQINRRLNDAIRAIPGVESAGTISHLPLDHLPNWSMSYWAEGAPDTGRREGDVRPVSPGLLDALGARMMAGRFFDESDDFNANRVIVVDRLLAERTWPGQDPIGKTLNVATWPGVPATAFRVIGVVSHVRYRNLEAQVREQLYTCVRQLPFGPYAFVVRSALPPDAILGAIRVRTRELDSRIPIWDVRPLQAYYNDAVAERRFTALLVGCFAAISLVLACVGVYGLLSLIVSGRQTEFGVRLALGADPSGIMRSVMLESFTWASIGVVIGSLILVLMAAPLSHLLYGVTIFDLWSWLVAIVVLVAMVAIASSLPAFRAGRTDAARLMRAQ
jgi:putative ABC transport system permease protein